MGTEGTLSSVWEQHVGAEFTAKSADEAVATMTAKSYVNLIPLMIGARGRDQVRDFYANHFVSQLPPDIEIVNVSRTIGQGQVVDELIIRFTHSIRMDWLMPGIPPTGKRVEVPMVAIIQFEGDKIAHEHLYWDQASLLVQLGLLDRTLPVRGGEIAAQVLNPTQPMNELIRRALNENGHPAPRRHWERMGACTLSDKPQSKQENAMKKSYWLVGTRLNVIAGQADTEGRYDLVDGWFPPGAQIAPHLHRRNSEQIYVLEGEFTVWAGESKAVLRPGDNFIIPAGMAHALAVSGDGPGRALIVASPSGFARLITEVGTPDKGGETPPSVPTDMDLLRRVAADLGDEFLGPPGVLPDEFAVPTGER
jgi:carboxymethylenebutenolidase